MSLAVETSVKSTCTSSYSGNNLRSDALNPSAGERIGQVSNSQGINTMVGGKDRDPVPDRLTAGQDKMTYMAIAREFTSNQAKIVSMHIVSCICKSVKLRSDNSYCPAIIIPNQNLCLSANEQAGVDEHQQSGKQEHRELHHWGSGYKDTIYSVYLEYVCQSIVARMCQGCKRSPGRSTRPFRSFSSHMDERI